MADDRGTRIEALCLAALAKAGAERAAFLEQACEGDAGLRREVDSLLAGLSGEAGFLEAPPWAPAPALAPGTRLGAFEIQSLIGEGGMGQVYRARDPRLDRTVAIKVLPPAFAADPERRARFEREAKAIASLNHSHICTIHDIGREAPTGGDGEAAAPLDFLVMEHLAGETLAARLERGPLPPSEAVHTGIEIAEALAAAHRQGVVHRDLKPGNVMLTGGGAKLLDFGLAKLRAHGEYSAASMGSTPSLGLTAEGTIVGTLHYMAPEQVEGQPADARTDVWALGAVLYEMVSGRRAFEGGSTASLIAGILQGRPQPLASLAPSVPPALDAVIQKCLAKAPGDRWQSAEEVLKALEGGGAGRRRRRGLAIHRPSRHYWIPTAVVIVAALATGVALWQTGYFTPAPPPRLSVLTSMPGYEGFPALSPDGRQVAFIWTGEKGMNPRLYLKVVGESEAKPLTTSPGFEWCPTWSPDGTRIGFVRGQPLAGQTRPGPPGIYTVSALGGDEQRLRDVPGLAMMGGLSWSPDKRWLAFSVQPPPGTGGIYVMPASGGDPVRITFPKGEEADRKPTYSWSGRFMAFTRSGGKTPVTLYVVPLSPEGMPSAEPRKVETPLSWAMAPSLAWSRDDESLIVSGNDSLQYLFRLRVDGSRPPERLDVAGPTVTLPSVAASGNRLAFTHGVDNFDIWRLFPGTPEPIVTSSYYDSEAQFSPDGTRLVFSSYRTGGAEIYVADADGSHPKQLTRGLPGIKGSPVWSPSGKQIAFDHIGADGEGDVYVVDADGGQLRRLTQGSGSYETLPAWSRDGQWIYFSSNRGGSNRDIWRIPAAGGEWTRVTTTGGGWNSYESADGHTLFYVHKVRTGVSDDIDSLMAKPLDGRPEYRLLDRVGDHGVVVMDDGIYYLVSSRVPGIAVVYFYDFAHGKSTEVVRYSKSPGTGLAVSPDRKTILCSVTSQTGSDLMLLDNFK